MPQPRRAERRILHRLRIRTRCLRLSALYPTTQTSLRLCAPSPSKVHPSERPFHSPSIEKFAVRSTFCFTAMHVQWHPELSSIRCFHYFQNLGLGCLTIIVDVARTPQQK